MFFFALLKEKLRNWSKKKTSLSFHELYSIYRLVKNILASAYGFIMNLGKFWKKRKWQSCRLSQKQNSSLWKQVRVQNISCRKCVILTHTYFFVCLLFTNSLFYIFSLQQTPFKPIVWLSLTFRLVSKKN